MSKNLNFIISPPRGGATELAYRLRHCGNALPHTHLIARASKSPRTLYSPLNLYNVDDGLARSISAYIFESKSIESIRSAYKVIDNLNDSDEILNLYHKLSPSSVPLYDPSFSLGLYPELLNFLMDKFPRSHTYICHKDPLLFIESILSSIYGLDGLILWHKAYHQEDENFDKFEPILMWIDLEKKISDQLTKFSDQYNIKHLFLKRASSFFLSYPNKLVNNVNAALALLPSKSQYFFIKYFFGDNFTRFSKSPPLDSFNKTYAYQSPMSFSGDSQVISQVLISKLTHRYLIYLKESKPYIIEELISTLMHPKYKHFKNSKILLEKL